MKKVLLFAFSILSIPAFGMEGFDPIEARDTVDKPDLNWLLRFVILGSDERMSPQVVADSVKNLIKNGADVNFADHYGFTALHHAVLGNNVPLCKLLVELGADLEAADKFGNTPFVCSVKCDNREASETFIEHVLAKIDANQKKRVLTFLNCLAWNEDPTIQSAYTLCILDSFQKALKNIIREENMPRAQKLIFQKQPPLPINFPESIAFLNLLKQKYCTPCTYCKSIVESMKWCGACKQMPYCSLGCQRSDWAKHKLVCKK